MYAGKPIIGMAGGIGSGKSTVAGMLGEIGCVVVDSDELAHQAYRRPEVVRTLQGWWGREILKPNGEVDRRAIAGRVFGNQTDREKLEGLLYPLVDKARREAMEKAMVENPQIPAFVWDTPLLFETGLNRQCDAVVFVEAPLAQRLARVQQSRGWDALELSRRENLQWPLDKKREISDYVVVNTADADYARSQISEVLSRTLAIMKSRI